MTEFKNILFPTDFSEPAHIAQAHALHLAGRMGASLSLLHVRTIHGDDPAELSRGLKEWAKTSGIQLESQPSAGSSSAIVMRGSARVGEATIKASARVVRNVSPAAGILDFLKEQPMDLVVMGTHGRSALAHFLLGSVAEKVVRHSHCPVLTVGHAREKSKPEYKSILVPVDFSEHSEKAVRIAKGLARTFGGKLQLLHVIEQEIHPAYYDIWRESLEKALPQIEKDARLALQKTLGDGAGDEIGVHVKVGEKAAHREIAEFASAQGVDLIVMATHGLAGLDYVLLGSTTERVVRIANCPVLTIK